MRKSQPTTEHAEAVSRRLASLSAEIAAVRGDPTSPPHAALHTQIRSSADVADGSQEEAPVVVPVVVPVPGRHASRRLSVGPFQFGSVHLAVVAVVAAAAVALASFVAIRDQAEPLPTQGMATPEMSTQETPLTPMSQSLTPGDETGQVTPGVEATPAALADVTVDVAGKVRRPGIAVLPSGSRVVDALKAAGGVRRGVDLTALNLARLLVDGEQILVGIDLPAGVAGTLGAPGSVGATPGSAALVNINTADQSALETLPGVGPVTAQAILAWRSTNGAFSSVDELLEVKGIGDATLADIAPHVTI